MKSRALRSVSAIRAEPGYGSAGDGSGAPRGAPPFPHRLLGFLVRRVLSAPPAELAVLHPFRVQPLVLGYMVVPLLTLAAGEDDFVAHWYYLGTLSVIRYPLSVLSGAAIRSVQ